MDHGINGKRGHELDNAHEKKIQTMGTFSYSNLKIQVNDDDCFYYYKK